MLPQFLFQVLCNFQGLQSADRIRQPDPCYPRNDEVECPASKTWAAHEVLGTELSTETARVELVEPAPVALLFL